MQDSAEGHYYETRCPRCDVSFPPEQKVCVHCQQRIPRHGRVKSTAELGDLMVFEQSGERLEDLATAEVPVQLESADEEQPERSRSPFRVLQVLFWVSVVAFSTIARMCSEGGG